jgi:RpiR family carbohydrate utilization transcriptional regulator
VNTPRPGQVIATIRSLLPSLLSTEQAVASVLLTRSTEIIELSSQQVAELAGASRATVVRTCQSLGFSGYQQLRVFLARDASFEHTSPLPSGGSDGIVRETFRHVAETVSQMTALLDDGEVSKAVEALAKAQRVVAIGNGLSSSLAMDVASRLASIGRTAEAPLDSLSQQITARLLSPKDVLLVISGSGSTTSTLRAAQAAHTAGAAVIAITAFARSPLAQIASIKLVVTMPDLTFRDEIILTSRLPQTILIEGLVAALTSYLGTSAIRAKGLSLDVVSDNLAE